LAAYLLYYATGWPVNPAAEAISSSPLTPLTPYTSYSLIPSLLHLYWSLHALHLILVALALRSWWTESSAQHVRSASDRHSATYSSYRLHLLTRIAPWAILAFLFYIPGVYLEWPSDPWEHLKRINEWRNLNIIDEHSSWHKFSYFIPFSLLSSSKELHQLLWVNVYYTGICLLLCWQYRLLAQACGASKRAAQVFVVLQVILFGNNIFSFYRYYGLSSSIYAQIGSVALTRIFLEFAMRGTKFEADSDKVVADAPFPSPIRCLKFWHLPSLSRLSLITIVLLIFIAFNHIQGLGIALLSVSAIAAWRLTKWRREMAGVLATGLLLSSIAVILWFPRNAAIDLIYRPHGWIGIWYGFNILTPDSPAYERALQIFGSFGIINLCVGIWLAFGKNQVAGWLTITPVIALMLPCFAIPLASNLTEHAPLVGPITFQRMLMATPCGLAFVLMLDKVVSENIKSTQSKILFITILLLFLIMATAEPAAKTFNRTWHLLSKTPKDQVLNPYQLYTNSINFEEINRRDTMLLANNLTQDVFRAIHPLHTASNFRIIYEGAPYSILNTLRGIDTIPAISPPKFTTKITISERISPHVTSLTVDSYIFPKTQQPEVLDLSRSEIRWTRLAGEFPEVEKSADGTLIIGNPRGAVSYAFTEDLIPILPTERADLSMTIRQLDGPPAPCYMGVAWYDNSGDLLPAGSPAPLGAGNPAGWHNGTLSYFGLIHASAPSQWIRYNKSFGPGEDGVIPKNAAYIRVGAILNNDAIMEAKVQLRDVVLRKSRPPKSYLVIIPSTGLNYTPFSLAAQLSKHWSAQKILIDHAASTELHAKALQLIPLNGTPLLGEP
jgi:hypothetical protein